MDKFYDFSKCEEYQIYKGYGGRNGGKIAIRFNNKKHMVKFNTKNNDKVNYKNSNISEYIACHIFESLGFDTQKTYLGSYTTFNKNTGANKVSDVVACEDFNQEGYQLAEFALIKNTCIDSPENGYGIELSSVLDTIDIQHFIDNTQLKEFFWDMFIADAFTGNFDRHNGNWGILVNEDKQEAKIAPIYDCGSCLYPQLLEKDLDHITSNQQEIDNRIFVFPNSALRINGHKINYFDYISSLQNEDCNAALLRIYPKINMDKIASIIDNTPGISEKRKQFYKIMLQARKEKILDYSFELLQKQNYNSIENISKSITRLLHNGIPFNQVEKEALKYIQGDNMITKKVKFKTALKHACQNRAIRKIVEKEQGLER